MSQITIRKEEKEKEKMRDELYEIYTDLLKIINTYHFENDYEEKQALLRVMDKLITINQQGGTE